jgi:hypothetical protein
MNLPQRRARSDLESVGVLLEYQLAEILLQYGPCQIQC